MLNSDENNAEDLKQRSETSLKRYSDGVHVAASLLSKDIKLVIFFIPFLIFPSFLVHYIPEISYTIILAATFIERVISITLFFILCKRWFIELSNGKASMDFSKYLRFLTYSLLLWIFVSIPTVISIFDESSVSENIFIFFIIPMLGYLVQYYFYFLPILIGRTKPREILNESLLLIKDHRLLPIKIILSPLILSGLFWTIAHSLSPDGRHLWSPILLDLSEVVFWFVSSYLSLGVGFSILTDKMIKDSNLDPYLSSRLNSIKVTAPKFVYNLINPRSSILIIILVVLIFSANLIRQFELEPAVKCELKTVNYNQPKLSLKLNCEDKTYNFRGFNPGLFRVAGEEGSVLTGTPPKTKSNGNDIRPLLPFPRDRSNNQIDLEFEIVERADDLQKLKDIYLYYGRFKYIFLSPRF